jgi:hypothetical protein
VQHVLTSILVYLAMAVDIPQRALNSIDKFRRGFLFFLEYAGGLRIIKLK